MTRTQPHGLSAGALGLLLLFAPTGVAMAGSVCIDAGHGGHDPGAVGSGLIESDLNLSAILYLRDWLSLDTSDTGGGSTWSVYLTRDDDTYVSLSGRCDYANSHGVDWFMSIHTNAGGGNGTETYAYASGGDSDDLAHYVQSEVIAHLGTYSRGVKYASFTVLTDTDMPADLNEMAFIDVWAGNAELLADDANLDDVALGHLHAIQQMAGTSAYTPGEVVTPDPTASISFLSLPTSTPEDEPFTVSVSYTTNLHELGQKGQIGLRMLDSSSWAVLDEQLWDNGGSGIQGPAGTYEFSEVAADPGSVFFVTWFSPLGTSYESHYDEASSASTPTTVTPVGGDDTGDDTEIDDTADTGSPKDPETRSMVEITSAPVFVTRSSVAELDVEWRWDRADDGLLLIERVDAETGMLLDMQSSDASMDGTLGQEVFEFPDVGASKSYYFVACLTSAPEISTHDCVAMDSTESEPTSVVLPLKVSNDSSCGCAMRADSKGGSSEPATRYGWWLLLAASVAVSLGRARSRV